MGLVLDTSVLIATERQGSAPELLFRELYRDRGNVDISISVISVLELDHGIYRASSPQKASARKQFSLDVCQIASILSITLEVARLAGRVEGEQAARGFAIPLADLLIGCTALQLGHSVLTLNPKHFQLIPNLDVLTP